MYSRCMPCTLNFDPIIFGQCPTRSRPCTLPWSSTNASNFALRAPQLAVQSIPSPPAVHPSAHGRGVQGVCSSSPLFLPPPPTSTIARTSFPATLSRPRSRSSLGGRRHLCATHIARYAIRAPRCTRSHPRWVPCFPYPRAIAARPVRSVRPGPWSVPCVHPPEFELEYNYCGVPSIQAGVEGSEGEPQDECGRCRCRCLCSAVWLTRTIVSGGFASSALLFAVRFSCDGVSELGCPSRAEVGVCRALSEVGVEVCDESCWRRCGRTAGVRSRIGGERN
ncbi:hypothetical protein C8Q78DRAFT_496511 [Trametes maxima]|nr:hypothetical protein C8Q78DRAFT_496511 [Trametes maxima]